MRKEALQAIVEDLQAGRTPELALEDFPAFSAKATAGNDHLGPESLKIIQDSLTQADIPVLERALRAMDEGDLAWLGFKLVYDPVEAQANTDNEVTKKYGDQGSANGESFLFFCNDAKEIVAAHDHSPRDTFQMKDVTRAVHAQPAVRGPHLDQHASVRRGARVASGGIGCGGGTGAAGAPCGL